MLEKGAEVNRAAENGRTPLLIACYGGHVDVARLLLAHGAEVDRTDKYRVTPLHAACYNGHVDVARLLLDKGAEVDQAKGDAATPLFVACEHGHVDAARLLLERGAVCEHDSSALCEGDAVEVRYRGREKYYPGKIRRDCGEGKYDIAYDDGERETRVEARLIRKLQRSLLAIAKENGHAAVVALLEEHMDLKFPLHAAARTGDVEAMTHLLDGGAEVDANKDGTTSLFVACEGGHVDAARLLLERGAVLDEHGSSALYEGDAVEADYRGRGKFYPGKISRDRGDGSYDIAYDDGERETRVEARFIRKLSLLAIAEEKGHSSIVALLEEHQK